MFLWTRGSFWNIHSGHHIHEALDMHMYYGFQLIHVTIAHESSVVCSTGN